jgi:tRNA uracil 4-sulfurtransferase
MDNSKSGMKKAILLLSGGIDSPVAAHLMQRKGYELIAVHFYNKLLADIDTVEKCKNICKKLGIKRLYLIAFDEQQAEYVRKCNHKYYYILTRRMMWRVAEKIAEKEGAEALVTGENLAQVSSQTLSNMVSVQNAVSIPILQPLLCNDKNETIKIAREIDTYEISIGPEVCCLLGPKHPATSSRIDVILFEEEKIDINSILDKSFNSVELCEVGI